MSLVDEKTWINYWISRRQAEQILSEGNPVKMFAVKGDERIVISHLMNLTEQDLQLVEELNKLMGYKFELAVKKGDQTFMVESPTADSLQ